MWHTNSKYFYFTLKHRQQSASGDLFTKYDVGEITARISNHTSCLMWDVITRPGYSFNGGFKYTTFEVKAMICNCEQLYYTNATRTTRTPAFWDTPCRPMITHTSDSHQTARQNKTKSKFQIKKMQNIQIVKFCRKLLQATQLLKLLDKIYENEMDPTRTVGVTEWTRDAGWTDRRTDGRS